MLTERDNMTKKKILAIVVGCVAALAVAGGIIFFYFITHSAIYRLAIGVKNVVTEVNQTENPLLMEEGIGSFMDTIGNQNVKADYSVNISGNPMLNGMTLGLDGMVKRDMENQKLYLSADASTSLIPLLSAEVYADSEDVYFQIPEIYAGSVIFQSEDFDGQYNESALRDYIGKTIDQDIDFDFYREFPSWEKGEESFLDAYHGDVKAFLKDIHISEEKGYVMEKGKEAILQEALGQKQKLTSYILMISSEKLGLRESVKIRIVLNQNNRIVMVEAAEGVLLQDDYRGYGTLLLCGGNVSIDKVSFEGGLTRREGGVDIHSNMTMTMEYHSDLQEVQLVGNGTMDIWEPGLAAEWDVSLSEYVPNERATVSVQNLHLAKEKEELGKVTGKAILQPMTEEITIPSDEEYALFEMNKLELGVLLWKWKDNLGGVLGTFFGEEISNRIAEEVGEAVEEGVKGKVGDIAEDKLKDILGEDLSNILADQIENLIGEKAGEAAGDFAKDKVGDLLNPDEADKEKLEEKLQELLQDTEKSGF